MPHVLSIAMGLAALLTFGVSTATADVIVDSPNNGGVTIIAPSAESLAVVPQPSGAFIYFRRPDCGVYRYWSGGRCVDARYTPPDLD